MQPLEIGQMQNQYLLATEIESLFPLGVEEMRRHIGETKKCENGNSQCPSNVSSLELSFSEGSNSSTDSKTSFTSQGSKQFVSADSDGMPSSGFAKKLENLKGDSELLDFAFSLSLQSIGRKVPSAATEKRPPVWEVEYIREILANWETMFEDPSNPLENQKTRFHESLGGGTDSVELERKVLFDCVTERMEIKFMQIFSRRFKCWVKWGNVIHPKELLAKELLAKEIYNEISGITCAGDSMVDKLVDNDMSLGLGKWVDIEELEEGVDIENAILISLINDLVNGLSSL